MTTFYGERYLQICDLVVSDSFQARLTAPHVRDLADSIASVELIHPPVVRGSDMQVVAGEDRVAAHVLLEREGIVCRICECDDDELEAMRRDENAKRRKETGEELLAMVEQAANGRVVHPTLEQSLRRVENAVYEFHFVERAPENATPDDAAEDALARYPNYELADVARDWDAAASSLTEEQRPMGRPKTARGKAIEQVAEATGRSPEAVRKATERAKKRTELKLETWGREQPAEWLETVHERQATLTDAASKVSAAMVLVTRLQRTALLHDSVGNRIYEELKRSAHELRMARPSCVCAWCKNLRGQVETCKACFGDGYLTEEQAVAVPEELKAPEAIQSDYYGFDGVPLESVRLTPEDGDPLHPSFEGGDDEVSSEDLGL